MMSQMRKKPSRLNRRFNKVRGQPKKKTKRKAQGKRVPEEAKDPKSMGLKVEPNPSRERKSPPSLIISLNQNP